MNPPEGASKESIFQTALSHPDDSLEKKAPPGASKMWPHPKKTWGGIDAWIFVIWHPGTHRSK